MLYMGKVYLVGAGPGDPDLITWKGRKLLASCDVVIYDRLASDRLLHCVREDCEKIYVGKASGHHSWKQEEINRLLAEKAKANQVVVRLKGGDPYVFGRGGEEVLFLREHGIPYEVIPGITSAIAALSYAGIPITHRGISQSFHVITGHTAEEENHLPRNLGQIAKLEGTIVVLMGLSNLPHIQEELIRNGKHKDTPTAVISNGTTPWQVVVKGTLGNICDKVEAAGIKSPAIIVVGNVTEYDLRTPEWGILAGAKIGISGTSGILDKLTEQLEELGAGVEIVSSSKVVEDTDNERLHGLLDHIEQYDWVVFTSATAVHITMKQLIMRRIDFRRMSKLKFAVIGRGTEEVLEQYGFQADFMPSHSSLKTLAEELCGIIGKEERIFIPRSRQGSDEILHILTRENRSFDEVSIYDILPREGADESIKWDINYFDYLTFASSSGVHGFMKRYSVNPATFSEKVKIVCIGDPTYATLKEYGFLDAMVAGEASVKGMIELICEDYRNHKQI